MREGESFDYIIIGSGVSGGRIAHSLTLAGARCMLLEAGREYSAKTFPRAEIDYSSQLFWGGGIELSTDAKLAFLRAKCVGGTSIVNQALLDRFDDDAWGDWKARSGVTFLNAREMEPHYQACSANLSIQEVPPQFYNRNARTFIEAFEKGGYGWKPLDRAQKDCKLEKGTDCIVCLGGCPRNSKQSALVTVIREAREKGLIVRSEFEVDSIIHQRDGVKIRGFHQGKATELRAPKVVLAAGALGNSAILLKSALGAKLPALGTAFTCHPQVMTYAFFDEPPGSFIDAHKGAFQAVKSEDPKLRQMGFKLENVFAQPVGTAMLFPGFGREHMRRLRKYRHYASMEVAIRDEASGRIRVAKNGKLLIDKGLTPSDQKKAESGLKLVRELFEGVGAKEIVSCTQPFGLHLMGGCPIGVNGSQSVVDPEFRVHDHPNLYCADSSIFPGAPGINPSFTIMALSHRAGEMILRERGVRVR